MHFYVDNTQLHLTFPLPSSAYAVSKLVKCIMEVCSCLTDNLLQLNDGKTGVSGDWLQGPAFTSAGHQAHHWWHSNISHSLCSESWRHLESSCSVQSHVKAVCQSACYYLRNIGRIMRYFDPETSRLVVYVLVTSRLDNRNSLLHGAPAHTVLAVQ